MKDLRHYRQGHLSIVIDINSKEMYATRFDCAEMLRMSYSGVRRLFKLAAKEKQSKRYLVLGLLKGYKDADVVPLSLVREWMIERRKFGLVEQIDRLEPHRIVDTLLRQAIE